MLHIIGFVLKCIGILLAIILGLIVLVLCVVLFMPIRYKVNAGFPGKVEEIEADVKVTWILRLLQVNVRWAKQQLEWKVKVAWKRFSDKDESVEKAEKPSKKASKKEPRKEKSTEISKTESVVQKNSAATKKEPEKVSKTVEEKKEEPQKEEIKNERASKESLWEKIKKKIQGIFEGIKYTFQKIYDKIKAGIDLKDKAVNFLTDRTHKAAFKRVIKELVWLKRFFRIKKGNINLRFGFDDPSTTGQVLAILSVIYPFIEGNMNVEPEFEEKCLEGQVYLKGHLRIIHLAVLAVKVILDKNVRKTYKDIMALMPK